jgi:DNA-binding transcriptional LysR family regulator
VELAQIKYFIAASRGLNFTRAATELNISQPALTKSIKNLEVELGAPLFIRERRRVFLTDFGHEMVVPMQNILEKTQAAEKVANSFRLLKRKPIRLGMMSSVSHKKVAKLMSNHSAKSNDSELEITEMSWPDLQKALETDQIDLAIMNPTGLRMDDYTLRPLYSEKYMVLLPENHELADFGTLTLSQLSGHNYVDRLACEMRAKMLKICEASGIKLYAKFRSEREDWVQSMVAAGLGFAFIPEHAVLVENVIKRPISDAELSRDIHIASMPGRKFSKAVQQFYRAATRYDWS